MHLLQCAVTMKYVWIGFFWKSDFASTCFHAYFPIWGFHFRWITSFNRVCCNQASTLPPPRTMCLILSSRLINHFLICRYTRLVNLNTDCQTVGFFYNLVTNLDRIWFLLFTGVLTMGFFQSFFPCLIKIQKANVAFLSLHNVSLHAWFFQSHYHTTELTPTSTRSLRHRKAVCLPDCFLCFTHGVIHW